MFFDRAWTDMQFVSDLNGLVACNEQLHHFAFTWREPRQQTVCAGPLSPLNIAAIDQPLVSIGASKPASDRRFKTSQRSSESSSP